MDCSSRTIQKTSNLGHGISQSNSNISPFIPVVGTMDCLDFKAGVTNRSNKFTQIEPKYSATATGIETLQDADNDKIKSDDCDDTKDAIINEHKHGCENERLKENSTFSIMGDLKNLSLSAKGNNGSASVEATSNGAAAKILKNIGNIAKDTTASAADSKGRYETKIYINMQAFICFI